MKAQTGQTKERADGSGSMNRDAVVAVYDNHEDAEKAILEIQRSGFDMKQLSIVGKDFHTEEDVVSYYNSGDRMKAWGERGAFWGGLWGLLFGSAFFFIPGVGPLLVAGPLVAWIISGLEGAVVVGGLSALGAGLYGMGIPKDSILQYETQLKAGKFLVIRHGAPHRSSKIEETVSSKMDHGIEGHRFPL